LIVLTVTASLGVVYLISAVRLMFRQQKPAVAAVLFVALMVLVNPSQIMRAIVSPGNNLTLTGNFLPYSRGVLGFLDEYMQPEMGIVQQHLSFPLRYMGIADEEQIHTYLYQDPDRMQEAAAFIAKNPAGGFIVVDELRNRIWAEGFPVGEDFTLGSTTIRYLGKIDEFYVYSWGLSEIPRTTLQEAMNRYSRRYKI
ncbi:MAG: hypothetical protein ACOCVC_09575, partial [Spirochaeta sp.]